MGPEDNVQGVHFVGSVPFTDAQTVFEKCGKRLGRRIARMPDGETGNRRDWVQCQKHTWGDRPDILNKDFHRTGTVNTECSDGEGQKLLDSLPPANTQYDTNALESFKELRIAKQKGSLPENSKFMVAIPTPLPVLCANFAAPYRKFLEKPYMEGLLNALENIAGDIPHSELAIQIDVAVEFAVLEGIVQPWFASPDDMPGKVEGVLQRVVNLAEAVPKDVDLGFHLCYGDLGHKHFTEPKDAGWLNFVAVELLKRVSRPVQFIQLPVPTSRDDAAYFAPLEELQGKRGDTEIYLGLVHPQDLQGTLRRIDTAGRIVRPFGVSTECGLGRTSAEDVDSIFDIMCEVATPWSGPDGPANGSIR